ncbi:MAG: cyclase family protein [Terriglobia bacterium]
MNKTFQRISLVVMLFLAIVQISIPKDSKSPTGSAPKRPLTKPDIDLMMTQLSNWGRWGAQDQLGTLNLLTPELRLRATRLAKEGKSVSLARPVETVLAPDNPDPFLHKMILIGADNPGQFAADEYAVSFHGHAHTHLDSLGHMFYNGKMYNGVPQETITAEGSAKISILALQSGILARGVLIDIARLKDAPYLEPGTAIYPEDLEAWEKKARIKVKSGDVVLIRTGRWARRSRQGAWDIAKESAGLHAACAAWLKQRDIAVLGSDDGSDVAPSGIEGLTHPIHQLMLVAAGIHILDCCDLEALSRECQQRQRWEFMFTVAPLAVPGGTGSPVNPIATF